MKKLTAGIFATILGVTAMGAADAAVTSKGYVDAVVGTVTQSVTDLGTTVAGHTTAITNLQTADTTLQGNIDELAGKVGDVPAGKNVIGIIDEKTSGIASEGTVSALSGRVDALETASATHAIKTEVDAALAGKADAQATANALELKADKTAIANMATTSDVATALQTAKDYADTNDADTVYNDAEVRGLISGNTTAITTLQEFDNSIKTATEGSVDGTYTLTMKKTGDVMTFGWELIQRGGATNE